MDLSLFLGLDIGIFGGVQSSGSLQAKEGGGCFYGFLGYICQFHLRLGGL